MERAEVGILTRERLSAVTGIMKVPCPDLDIFVLRHFLTQSECNALIDLIDQNRKPSRLMSDNPDPTFRTSETCNLDRCNSLVRDIELRLSHLTGIDLIHGEFLQGQRYDVGQEFKPHHDYLRTTEPYWPRQEKLGGQRTWTAMMFLNVPAKGGETCFPRLDLKIPPRQGTLVAWNNLDSSGEPNRFSLHQGLPVVDGVKYILTKWYRERPWGLPSS